MDIRAGATDEFLMKKYGLSGRGLQSLLEKLLKANVLSRAEYNHRRAEQSVESKNGRPDHLARQIPEQQPAAAFETSGSTERSEPTEPELQTRQHLWYENKGNLVLLLLFLTPLGLCGLRMTSILSLWQKAAVALLAIGLAWLLGTTSLILWVVVGVGLALYHLSWKQQTPPQRATMGVRRWGAIRTQTTAADAIKWDRTTIFYLVIGGIIFFIVFSVVAGSYDKYRAEMDRVEAGLAVNQQRSQQSNQNWIEYNNRRLTLEKWITANEGKLQDFDWLTAHIKLLELKCAHAANDLATWGPEEHVAAIHDYAATDLWQWRHDIHGIILMPGPLGDKVRRHSVAVQSLVIDTYNYSSNYDFLDPKDQLRFVKALDGLP